MIPLTPGKINRMDGEGLTDAEVQSRGLSSLKKRGKILLLMGVFSHIAQIADAHDRGNRAASILSGRQGAMRDAIAAAKRGDIATARECLTGVNRDRTVYRELALEVNVLFANGFRAAVDPVLLQAMQDIQDFEAEIARINK